MELARGESSWQGNISNLEIRFVWIPGNNEGSMFGTKEIWTPGSCHARHREVIGEPVIPAQLVTCNRSHAGMEAYEGTTADRDAGWCPGHHVMVSGSVVTLVVTD